MKTSFTSNAKNVKQLLISIKGLLVITGLYNEAKVILLKIASFYRSGLMPSQISDYNTYE